MGNMGRRAGRRGLGTLAGVCLLTVALLVPAAQAERAAVTGYSKDEATDLYTAANYLGMAPETLQVFGVQAARFVLTIAAARPDPIVGALIAGNTGAYLVPSVYLDGEQHEALDWVMAFYGVDATRAQRVGATFIVFLAGLDAAVKGAPYPVVTPPPPPTLPRPPSTTVPPATTASTSTTTTTVPPQDCTILAYYSLVDSITEGTIHSVGAVQTPVNCKDGPTVAAIRAADASECGTATIVERVGIAQLAWSVIRVGTPLDVPRLQWGYRCVRSATPPPPAA